MSILPNSLMVCKSQYDEQRSQGLSTYSINSSLNGVPLANVDLMEDNRDVELLGEFNNSLFTMLLEDIEDDERSEIDIA